MLDAIEPPNLWAGHRFEKLASRAREVAARRTQSLEIPDGHAMRVASLAADIARRIGFRRHEIDPVVEGALLHDLGKTRVPSEILDQRRPLTEDEYATVKKHPDWGAALVDGHVPDIALRAIRHHHEWWNGGGYPSRLAAQDIPIEARIVAVVDAYSAITTRRAYKGARTHAEAIAELRRSAGTHLDPRAVQAFVRVTERVARGGVSARSA
jgi:putative nucleotidyltransferase with HDIG domain